MTPDERTLVQGFLGDLSRTSPVAKDPEAEAMIESAVRANPDAVYLLVQHALLSDQALHSAQQQIQALQSQPVQQQGPAPSFLPSQTPWGGPLVQSSPMGGPSSGLGGFLRSAGTMAAGVAGGDLLARGVENLFGSRW